MIPPELFHTTAIFLSVVFVSPFLVTGTIVKIVILLLSPIHFVSFIKYCKYNLTLQIEEGCFTGGYVYCQYALLHTKVNATTGMILTLP